MTNLRKPERVISPQPQLLDAMFVALRTRMYNELNFELNDNQSPYFGDNSIYLAKRNERPKKLGDRKQNQPRAISLGDEQIDLRYNSNFASSAFLYEHGRDIQGNREFAYDVSLIVSYNQSLLMPNVEYFIEENFINDVVALLRRFVKPNNLISSIDVFSGRQNKEVWTDWTVDYKNHIFTNDYNHFRIRFKTEHLNPCTGLITKYYTPFNNP